MVRIITPKGELRRVKRVAAVCEMRHPFNGRLDRKIEIAHDLSCKPTGLCLEFYVENTVFGACGQEVFIGNLKTEAVQEILRKLLKAGYFDFSELEYQKAELFEKTVFDEGKSKPYTSDYITEFCSPLLSSVAVDVFDPRNPIVSGSDADVWEETGEECDEDGCEKEGYDDKE